MNQLAFELASADAANRDHRERMRLAWLPDTEPAIIAWAHSALGKHHKLMLACEIAAALAVREQLHQAAEKMHGDAGILAHPDAGGYRLMRALAHVPQRDTEHPLWGQPASFIVELERHQCRVRIETRGVFEIGARHHWEIGFDAHAVDLDQPFISTSGFYSFIGFQGYHQPVGYPAFVRGVIENWIGLPRAPKSASQARGLGGDLVMIDEQHRARLQNGDGDDT